MATIALQVAASTAARVITPMIFGSGGRSTHRDGARLEELSVQTSTYGKFIPLVYGYARIAGNVIWSRPIREVATTTTTSQGKGGGGSATSSSTEYSYFVSLAIAICEGEVDAIERVWADAKQLDVSLGTYRFFRGSETQLPDSFIEGFEGVGSTPAYRGLCYVVIEDFPLGDYGNRIPNFTFEVKKKLQWPDVDGESVENLLESIVMIPGSGEFVYDTQIQQKVEGESLSGEIVQRGEQTRINMHNPYGMANAKLAIDQLAETCPNIEWVAVVVNWFGTSETLTSCSILPGVEFGADQATTVPEVWSAAGFSRATAHAITYVGDTPRYGGTPDDQSLVRFCTELKNRGYKILLLPLFLMDTNLKPWRGRLTGAAADIGTFFTKTNGYNAYITHYANLLVGKVDAFAIGSELRGLTEAHDGASINRQFPGVNALVSLAATVKGILGGGVKVTYAADWSEYHHTTDGWYHMDPLWASAHIDVIGIDAYFPLTDEPQSQIGYNPQNIKQGWTSGEGYDFYYTDGSRTTTAPLGAAYAWKNIQWFWENTHTNPDGNVTAWTPETKKIWFTEFGFPSVDGATNQPNVFYDPTSSESYFPYHSRGRIDFRAQRAGIAATLAQWKDSDMIEQMFLWAWDARPYPYWPDLRSVWADGEVWRTGHWVQGKLGLSALAAIVADLCLRAGVELSDIDVSRLNDQVEGFVVNRQETARMLIEQLMSAYFFDAAETDGELVFLPRTQSSVATLTPDEMLPPDDAARSVLQMTRAQELELPRRVEVNYLNRLSQYQTGTQATQRQVVDATDTDVLNLPIVMGDQRARVIADQHLYQRWISRTEFQFDLPMRFAALEPADVVEVEDAGMTHRMRITRMQLGKPGRVRITALADDVSAHDFYAPPAETETKTVLPLDVAATQLRLLDLPALAGDAATDAPLWLAAAGLASNWPGAVIYRSNDAGASYGELVRINNPATMGTAITALPDGPRNRSDAVAELELVLLGQAELSSVGELALLNGANLMQVGEELIQFQYATLIAPHHYRLSRLLRGRLGTEWAMGSHSAGESCVLIDAALARVAMPDGLIGLARDYKAVSIGKTLGSVAAQPFTYRARALVPYAPVHIRGQRDGAGNLTLRWVRRTRIGGQWRDGSDVPLSEQSERYMVEIMDGSDMVRSTEVNNPEYIYSAAHQISDFGAPQSSISIRLYQISDQIGAGDRVQALY